MSDLRDRLRALGLLAVRSALDDLVALATKKRWGGTSTTRSALADDHVTDLIRGALEHSIELPSGDDG